MKSLFSISFLLFIWGSSIPLSAHPTGNMITVGEYVIWTYVYPVHDTSHRSSVMIWKPDTEPQVWFTSAHSSSDFMFYNEGETIYIVERKRGGQHGHFEQRILKASIGEDPQEIWPWFSIEQRMGEGAFKMLTEEELLFASYPSLYTLKKGAKRAHPWIDFDEDIYGMRPLSTGQYLIKANNAIWLTDEKGALQKEWKDFIDPTITNAFLGRNTIFDVDYRSGKLVLAYWGKRSFELISNGTQETILQLEDPYVSHWVATSKHETYLFASKFVLDGSTPKPFLQKINADGSTQIIWKTK